MLVVISPTAPADARRAGARAATPTRSTRRVAGCFPPSRPNTTADRAGDLLAATSALTYLQIDQGADAPEAVRLTDRIRGLVAELITLQNDDGGWPWVAGTVGPGRGRATG